MTGLVPVVETGIDTPHPHLPPLVRGNPAGESARVQGRSVDAGLGARDPQAPARPPGRPTHLTSALHRAPDTRRSP